LPAHVKAIAARSGGAVRLACLDRRRAIGRRQRPALARAGPHRRRLSG
jgi:hypothetical protein